MQNIKELKTTMSVQEQSEPVLRAMEAVATRQFLLTQQAITDEMVHSHNLDYLYNKIQQSDLLVGEKHPLMMLHPGKKDVHAILLSVQNGLFCQPLLDEQFRYLTSLSDRPASYTPFGDGSEQLIKRMRAHAIESAAAPSILEGLPAVATMLAQVAEDIYVYGEVGSVRIVGVTRNSQAIDKPLLPIQVNVPSQDKKTNAFDVDGDLEVLIDTFFHLHLTTRIYDVLLETQAAEQQTRRLTSHGAVEYIQDTLPDLRRRIGGIRRAKMTREILEMQ